jgi:hypothetical protein
MYDLYQFDQKFPSLYGWFQNLKHHPDLQKEIIPVSAFKLWLEELATLPAGRKPPLRLPMKL